MIKMETKRTITLASICPMVVFFHIRLTIVFIGSPVFSVDISIIVNAVNKLS